MEPKDSVFCVGFRGSILVTMNASFVVRFWLEWYCISIQINEVKKWELDQDRRSSVERKRFRWSLLNSGMMEDVFLYLVYGVL